MELELGKERKKERKKKERERERETRLTADMALRPAQWDEYSRSHVRDLLRI